MKALRAVRRRVEDDDLMKRDRLITIRASAEDLDLLKKAGERLWPAESPPTNSTLVLTLAKMQAREILKKKGRPAER